MQRRRSNIEACKLFRFLIKVSERQVKKWPRKPAGSFLKIIYEESSSNSDKM